MIWETYNHAKAINAESAAARAEMKEERQSQKMQDVSDQVERLSLACQAMWELIRDRTQLTEQDLENKITEIDGRDGRVDGKISTQSLNCHNCGKPTHSKRSFCVMCGAPLRRQHKFEA